MALTGNFQGLALVRANLARLARVPAQAAQSVARGLTAELQRQFAEGHDPYDRAWKPKKSGKGRTLVRSGSLAGSAVARPMAGAGVRIGPFPSYASFHQTGTKKMVARPILPYGGLPARWNAIIKAACTVTVNQAMEGR